MNVSLKQSAGLDAYLNLGEIVADLRKLRAASQKRRYREGRLPELPSREAMTLIVDGLAAALYPRHFGPSELTVDCTDGYLLYTLSATLRSLQEQVRRELHLHDARSDLAPDEHGPQSLEIVREFAASLPNVRALLDTDIRAAFDGDPAAKSLDEVVFCYPGVSAMIRHRLAHRLYLLGVPMLARIIAEAAHSQTAIDIHPGAQIGESFFIDHGAGVVIGETAVIGRNVRVYQAVTLGAKRFDWGIHLTGVARRLWQWNAPVPAPTTLSRLENFKPGSRLMQTAWTTWNGYDGLAASSARPVVIREDGGLGTAGSCAPDAVTALQ